MIKQGVIFMMTLRYMRCLQKRNAQELDMNNENISKFRQLYHLNVPFDPIKKINANTLCLYLLRKLYAFEKLNWAQGSQWRK